MRLLALMLALAGMARAEPKVYPHRWVLLRHTLQSDADVENIRELARVASEHGLNGVVLTGSLDSLYRQGDAYFRRLAEVRRICQQHSLEIIPTLFSAGYGGAVLGRNRNLAEGLPVRDALFVVKNQQATLAPDPEVSILNGGFEEFNGNRFPGYNFHDRPGEVSFADTDVRHSGAASIRYENFGNFPYGHGRLMQEAPVKPYRCYRVTAWVKSDQLQPASAFRVQVLVGDRSLAPWDPLLPSTTEWRKLQMGFNSGPNDRVRIYASVWEGRSGRFWVDDLALEEVGLTNVLRRPGTPLTVRGEDNDTLYEEGADFLPVGDPQLTFRFDHEGPPIRVVPGRIPEGQRLRVSYYHGQAINDGQVSLCMSEPELYDIWADQARRIHDLMAPSKYVLSMDEIRLGGTCEACRRRGMSMAQILGDCFTRQFEILRALNPEAEVITWSDMLDPNHNARAGYYLVDGDYSGSWQHVPPQMGIMCWYFSKRKQSLEHFSSLGFRTYAGAYYDGDNLDNPRGWLEAMDEFPGAAGIMYTTWENKYGLLADFGDLVSKR